MSFWGEGEVVTYAGGNCDNAHTKGRQFKP